MNVPLPNLPLIDGNTLFIDNSRLENFMTCARLGEYVIVRKRISSDEKMALFQGRAVHLALKYRYQRLGSNAITKEVETRQMVLLEQFYANKDVPLTEFRTCAFAQNLIRKYNECYPREDFLFVQTPKGNMVECPFSVPLGKVGDYNIVWTGRVDGAVIPMDGQNKVYVSDHKTSSVGGDGYFDQYYTASQMKGYVFALQHILGLDIEGVYMNVIWGRRETKTGKGIEFARRKITFSPEIIADWQEQTLHICGDFLAHHRRGFFPMHTTQCIRKFGRCEMHSVCTMDPESRHDMLYSSAYKDDDWSPLHEDELNFDDLDKVDISNWSPRAEVREANELSDTIAALLGI